MTDARSLLRRCLRPALLLLALFAIPAQAETYRIDVIVFVDLWAGGAEAGNPPATPSLRNAIDVDDAAALRAAGIELLPEDQSALNDAWQHLRYSKQFKPLMRLSWTQKDPPQERGPSVHVRIPKPGDETGAPIVDGSIALLLGRYLQIDADLQYVADGQAWPLAERRRMRRDETHHLDSARLGILTQVSKPGAAPDAAE